MNAEASSCPQPNVFDPPWRCTITGRCEEPVAASGAKTLRKRQFSFPSVDATPPSGVKSEGCRHGDPKLAALRTPLHEPARAGGRKRRAPIGAAAYGMPRHSRPDDVVTPSIAPLVVTTIGPEASAGATTMHQHVNANKPTVATRIRIAAQYADVEPISTPPLCVGARPHTRSELPSRWATALRGLARARQKTHGGHCRHHSAWRDA